MNAMLRLDRFRPSQNNRKIPPPLHSVEKPRDDGVGGSCRHTIN
jgi:hypothetical protein